MSYFSQKEFEAFVAGEADRLRLGWLALSGRTLTEREREELQRMLEDFFLKKGDDQQ